MRVLFIGDVVGTPGMNLIKKAVPFLRRERELDFVVVNAENVAAGSGMYPSNFHAIRKAGVDGITMGDHIYRRVDLVHVLRQDEPIARPVNYPEASPGKEYLILKNERGLLLAVVSLIGRLYMKPVDCPFRKLDAMLPAIRAITPNILVDFHAEATGEKYQAKHYFDGKVSALLGTHTHVPTADAQLSAAGTAYQSDVGMTGGHAGILGRKAKPILDNAYDMVPTAFDVEEGDPRLNGTILEIDETTGRTTKIQPLVWTPSDNPS